MNEELATVTDWYIGFSNSTGQPGGDKIVLSRVAPHFIRLEIEAPGICAHSSHSPASLGRNRRVLKCIQQAVLDLQKQSFALMNDKAG